MNNHYYPDKKPSENSFFLSFKGREALLRIASDGSAFPMSGKDIPGFKKLKGLTYLLSVDDMDFFLIPEQFLSGSPIDGDLAAMTVGSEAGDGESVRLPADCVYIKAVTLRRSKMLPKHLMFAVNTCRQLASWYEGNRFCGRCAGEMTHSDKERALVCTKCGRTVYPRINPAVIIGITKGDEILMTRYSDRDLPYFALVAGFTEIGETFEQTVEREALEETGLKVHNIRYYKSQPWPFADDILAGYYCDVDGDADLRIDKNELKTAVWVKRDEITGQPDDFSLTNEMMMTFKAGREPK